VQDLKAVSKNKTQKLCYVIKKITLSLYRYICMHASYASSTAAHVGSNARAGGWSVQLQFLMYAYVIGGSVYTCIQKCMYSQIICDCLWRFTFWFIILECNLFIIILLFLLSFCCFTSLYLLGLCSNVGHHFLQGMMLVAASLNRALVDLYNLKDHYNQE